MRTYTFAQSLISNQLKGYHFAVNAEGTSQFDGWVIANIQFFSVGPKNKQKGIVQLPICNIGLFQLKQQLKSYSLVAKVVKERKEVTLQFKQNQEFNGPARGTVDNAQYLFFEDLIGVIQNKFDKTVIQEGKSDFFTLIEYFQWTSQKIILEKQKKSLSGISWSSIALWSIGSALLIGVVGVLFKKKQ